MTTSNRDSLLKLLNLVRPALSTQSFIPALTHILFADGYATAYNDVTAISVKVPVLLEECLPGELLIKALGSFNAETVMLQPGEKCVLHLTSGRSKLKLPTLAIADFPYSAPKDKGHTVELTESILQGIAKCLFSVGTDPTHAAQMGVTLDTSEGKAVLYSTDNHTISRYQTSSALALPGDAPVILPTFFCEQLLTLSKAFPDRDVDLHVHAGALRATLGKSATVLTKTVVDVTPLDYGMIIGKYLNVSQVKQTLNPIPDSFDAAWNRALLILSLQADRATEVSEVTEGFRLFSKSSVGESEDVLAFEHGDIPATFHVDPSLVIRAGKQCGSIAFYKRVMVMASPDAAFLHLIAHCAA